MCWINLQKLLDLFKKRHRLNMPCMWKFEQQALSNQQAFGYSYTPWGYQFRHRKMAIWSYKSLMYGFTGRIAK
jgi:hypothetical protein